MSGPQIETLGPGLAVERRHAVVDRALRRPWLGRYSGGESSRRRRRQDARRGDGARRVPHRVFEKARHHGGAGLQHGLADDEAAHLAFDAIGIDELPAGHLIEAQPCRRQAILVSILHLRLAFDQPGQQIVAEHQISRGGEHGRADQRQQGGSAEQSEARDLEAAALLTARHMHDVIRVVLDELKRPFTQGHVTFPGRRYAAGAAVPARRAAEPRRPRAMMKQY